MRLLLNNVFIMKVLVLCLTGLFFQGCDYSANEPQPAKPAPVYFPPPRDGGGWHKNVSREFVESRGLNYDALQELGRSGLSIKGSGIRGYDDHNHGSVLFIKDGWIVGEWYLRPETKTFQQYLSSNGKSFAYILFGILMKEARQGLLPVKELSEQSKLYDRLWLSDGYPLSDPRKERITFEQVFRHTSGLMPEATADGTKVEMGRYSWSNYGDWLVGHDAKFPMTGKLFFDPGKPEQYAGSEVWGEHRGAYSSIGFAHLGTAFRHISGHTADGILWHKLLKPIGFDGISYHYPSRGYHRWFTGGGLRMTARDYARFAYLLLNKGRWQKKYLVDEHWVNRTFETPYYQNLRSNVDGYFGKKYPRDMLRIFGSGGNFAFIIPSQGVIALHCGRICNTLAEKLEERFLRILAEVLEGPNAANSQAVMQPRHAL